jgi:hypothetical protein
MKTISARGQEVAVMADNITYFVALPFMAADDGVAPGEPVECIHRECHQL